MTMASHRPTRYGAQLTPLALAMAAAWPLQASGQAVARPAAPAVHAVPVPAVAWRILGNGAAAPSNTANHRGGIDQVIDQSSSRAIYHWQRFDIGAASSVTFNLPDASSSALNRVIGSSQPSAIFGALRSQVPNPLYSPGGPQPRHVTGGQIFLLNGAGILFGRDAQVNVGALIASTMNVDDSDFIDGLRTTTFGPTRSFFQDPTVLGAPSVGPGFVAVDQGATITTPNGGRVFLFADEVENSGRIETPGGQTVLAAGREVFLQSPTVEKLYASEVNAAVPALRGLLVEVGIGDGTVTNRGEILTPRGNTTLVGMAVNQLGRISATTSVNENGSVMLLARGAATAVTGADITKRATVGGVLTLGPHSRIEIAPDATLDADGKPPTSNDTSADPRIGTAFTTSRIEMSGQRIVLEDGTSIAAPGAAVRLRAESVPDYELATGSISSLDAPDVTRPLRAFDPSAGIVIGRDVRIDVAGTQDTQVGADRNFVTTALLGANDLKDAPLQKSGPLYRSTATFDIREDVPILGDLSSYRLGIARTVSERLSAGGKVLLESTGSVTSDAHSSIDVSGGLVTFTPARVTPSYLTAENGARYTLADAPADQRYSSLSGSWRSASDRWGPVTRWQAAASHVEAGYAEGRAAGMLRVLAQQAQLDGRLDAGTVRGERQMLGLDPLARGGSFQLGLAQASGTGVQTPVELVDSASGQAVIAAAGSQAEAVTRLSRAMLAQAQLGQIVIASDVGVRLLPGEDFELPDRAGLSLYARGSEGVEVQANVLASGGSVTAQTVENVDAGSPAGDIRIADGVWLDVAGRVLNQRRDGPTAPGVADAGSVALRSGGGLHMGAASRIDASGGATVRANGSFAAGKAGSITLSSQPSLEGPRPFDLKGSLLAHGLASGGSLTLRAGQLSLGGDAGSPQQGGVSLDATFLSRGGFENLNLDGYGAAEVAAGQRLQPRLQTFLPTTALRDARTGEKLSAVLPIGEALDGERRPVHLTLQSSGSSLLPGSGDLHLGAGASLVMEPTAKLVLRGADRVRIDGQLGAPAGSVTIQSVPLSGGFGDGYLALGNDARIDVSGTLLRTPSTDGLLRGRVLDGGTVRLAASALQVEPGAVIAARGSLGALDGGPTGLPFAQGRTQVASAGGRIEATLEVRDGGDGQLAGRMALQAGGTGAAAGTLDMALSQALQDGQVDPHRLLLAGAGQPATALTDGKTFRIDPAAIQASGAGELNLRALDRIEMTGVVDMSLARRITLDAPQLVLGPQADVQLQAASARLGNSSPQQTTPASQPGDGRIVLRTLPATGAEAKGTSLDVVGHSSISGARSVVLDSAGEIRLHGVGVTRQGVTTTAGALHTDGDLRLAATQLSVSSDSDFTVDAGANRLVLHSPLEQTLPTAPLSGGGRLALHAGDIEQHGVLRVPLGSIVFEAENTLLLGPASLSSVSGAGLEVPFGSTRGGTTWSYGGREITAMPDKRVELSAPKVDIQAGAQVTLTGGGELLALEFVAGPGGSQDIFAGNADGAMAIVPGRSLAPLDRHILEQVDRTGAVSRVPAGREIVIARDLRFADQVLPSGRYALLPARYAVLDGAFLVRPVGGVADTGSVSSLANGALRVGAHLGTAGTSEATALPAAFDITPSAVARESSEIRTAASTAYLQAEALRKGVDVPRLARDAGTLNVAASQLGLGGQIALGAATGGRAGDLGIASQAVEIRSIPMSGSTALQLSPEGINASGAGRVIIGGVSRQEDDGSTVVETVADRVLLDNPSQPLAVGDLLLTARQELVVAPGAQVRARADGGGGGDIRIDGEGAALRVSALPATLERRGARDGGVRLEVGNGARLDAGARGSLSVESSGRTRVDSGAELQGGAVTLGAGRIVVGGKAEAQEDALVLTGSLAGSAAQPGLNQVAELTLRSYGELRFEPGASLGSATQQALHLDSPQLALAAGSDARVEAGRIQLSNSTGVQPAVPAAGDGQLQLNALRGELRIGPGNVAVSGARQVDLQAAGSVLLSGTGSFAVPGELRIEAASLSAEALAQQQIVAAGAASLQSRPGAPTQGGGGAQLEIVAPRILQAGTLDLPGGQVLLRGRDGVDFGAGSTTSVRGGSSRIDGVEVATPAGRIVAETQSGSIGIAADATLDVSATGSAHAGTLRLSAPQGQVDVAGQLRGSSEAGRGATLQIDARQALDLAALATGLAAAGEPGARPFHGALELRNRQGDLQLPAGATLESGRIALSSDGGRIDIDGRLSAVADHDARITLAAGQGLTVHSGAELVARNADSAPRGGRIELMSAAGALELEAGATLAAPGGAQDGTLLLRAPRTGVTGAAPGGTGVAVAPIAAQVDELSSITVEAVRRYDGISRLQGTASSAPEVLNTATVGADNRAFAGSNGANLRTLATALSGGSEPLASRLRVTPGVEIRSRPGADDGGLTLAADWNLFGSVPGATAGVQVTLRSAGHLTLTHSLSDGFSGTTVLANAPATTAPAASFRLVGGADFAAADPLATDAQASRGDVRIGRQAANASTAPPVVLLRTTTGDIDIAAAQDLRIGTFEPPEKQTTTDQRSQVRVYTTGTPVPAAQTPGFADITIRASDQFLRSGTTTVGPFFDNAGDIRLSAGRDVLASPAATYETNGRLRQLQYVTDWLYRQTQAAGETIDGQAAPSRGAGVAMWARYDQFAQGVASFGGGNLSVNAARDIRDLDASTPFSGYRIGPRVKTDAGTGQSELLPEQNLWWDGGVLDVQAGRNLVGGLYFGGGPAASVAAAGAIETGSTPSHPNAYRATQLFYGNTRFDVTATGHVSVASPTHPGLIAGAVQGIERQPRTDAVAYMAPQAAMNILSVAGDVSLDGARPTSTSGSAPGAAAVIVPDELTVAAPVGAIRAGTLAQQPVDAAALRMLAEGPVALAAVRITAAETSAATPPQSQPQATVVARFNAATRQWSRAANPAAAAADDAPALQLVSRSADVSLGAVTSFVGGPARLIADRDLIVDGGLLLQHPDPTAATAGQAQPPLTLLQAGRDLRIGELGSVRLSGPGELVALAGRDIDFGRGQGMITIGNQDNDLQLPRGGSNITLLAGAGWSDYRQAVERRFDLLGSGFRNFPAEVLVQLEALATTGSLLEEPQMLAQAKAFAKLDAVAQRARVAALVGEGELTTALSSAIDADIGRAESLSEAANQAVRAGQVQSANRTGKTPPVPGGEFLPGENVFPEAADAAARDAAQASVRERLRDALPARALAEVLERRALDLPQATREALALAISPYRGALVDYVSRVAGPVTDAPTALRSFERLAPERQAVFLNQVLAAELNVAGNLTLASFADRKADATQATSVASAALDRAALTAIEAPGNRVNYLRGFDAMDALFPGARPLGAISLSNSQVKTAQGGDIRMFTPGGGVNVGDLAGGGVPKSASDIGVVTVAGGGIDMAVAHSVEVNQSRVFTLQDGNLLLWARLGNLDAGRGAKTVVGAPPPLFTINSQGQVVVDTSGSFSGSGIAVLGPLSIANLYAPLGEINAGDAGISVAGQLNVGANTIANFDNVQAANPVPGQGEALPSTAGLAGLGQAATSAGLNDAQQREEEEQERRNRRGRRNLLLEFLGFNPAN
jgi:hypothetical protein